MQPEAPLTPKDLGIREDGIDLSSREAPLQLFEKIAKNAQKGQGMDFPSLHDDMKDFRRIGGLENPHIKSMFLKVGQDQIIWTGQYAMVEKAILADNLPEIREELGLAHDLGMDLPQDNPQRQPVVHVINRYIKYYAEKPTPVISQIGSEPEAETGPKAAVDSQVVTPAATVSEAPEPIEQPQLTLDNIKANMDAASDRGDLKTLRQLYALAKNEHVVQQDPKYFLFVDHIVSTEDVREGIQAADPNDETLSSDLSTIRSLQTYTKLEDLISSWANYYSQKARRRPPSNPNNDLNSAADALLEELEAWPKNWDKNVHEANHVAVKNALFLDLKKRIEEITSQRSQASAASEPKPPSPAQPT